MIQIKQASFTITPIFRGGLGNLIYQIATTLSLSRDLCGEAIFYKQVENDEKDYRPFGGHKLISKEGLPNTLFELFPRLNFLPKPMLHNKAKAMAPIFVEKEIRKYEPIPTIKSNTILEGYFFAHNYFSHNLHYIRECLQPAESVTAYINNKYGHLLNNTSVSLHLRLGNDCDNFKIEKIPFKWYQNLIGKFNRNSQFIVCSDNIEKAKILLNPLKGQYNFHFVENEPMYVDLFVMSRCRHHILHSSTLSSWVAYLDGTVKKKVYYHEPFFSSLHGEDAIPEDWKDADPFFKRIEKFWKREYQPTIINAYVSAVNCLRTCKRNFLHRIFGTYYILDHEKEYPPEKNK